MRGLEVLLSGQARYAYVLGPRAITELTIYEAELLFAAHLIRTESDSHKDIAIAPDGQAAIAAQRSARARENQTLAEISLLALLGLSRLDEDASRPSAPAVGRRSWVRPQANASSVAVHERNRALRIIYHDVDIRGVATR
ncbi:hypothetical protein EVG20_g11656 [Dentipellis fragilis]|uniref:Uncharacterized protein n=1 Tax=Dentipellis fragilis TaxID=205917 RepID=A0A4Y9XJP9_9AGAM|nr:hypothetical protein EVG20_g11656 [Dentipellis fragilis]